MKNGVYEITKVLYKEAPTPLVIMLDINTNRPYQKPFDTDDIDDLLIEEGRFLIKSDNDALRLLGTAHTKEEALAEYDKFTQFFGENK